MAENANLHSAQQAFGGVFLPHQNDRAVPLHFGTPTEEYTAATTVAAVVDFSDHDLLELSGADRVKFLHSFCTNDVKRLSAGEGCEAFITNVKGRVLGHVWINATDSSLWLDAVADSAERLVPHLERYVINEDVSIADRSSEFGLLLVVGPDAAARLTQFGFEVAALDDLDHLSADVAGTQYRVRRFDVGPYRGYVLTTAREKLGDLWTGLCGVGVRPAGSEVWNALRIEAGLPIYGVDITDENLAQEVGRSATAISFTKGCYLGQEPIARLDAMGHVNRELRSLRLSAGPVPQVGASVFADASLSQPVGTVTSAAYSFGSRTPVALALLRSSVSAAGSTVFVKTEAGGVGAEVFWRPTTK